MKKVMFLLFVLLLSSFVHAEEVRKGSITLLALMESNEGRSGSVAKLELELRPGSERVFLETFPMTKVTTQASLRFAQQIACKQVDVDCSKYDFLFTIKSLPGIVGGPSAGGAAALLTASLLLDKPVPSDIAMTGTINSGGLIGPVGGLKYKVEAAGNNGIRKVLLPKGTVEVKEDSSNESNTTINLVEFGESLNLSVVEVAALDDVLESVLGVPKVVLNGSLEIEGRYKSVMESVARDLCARNDEFVKTPLKSNNTLISNFTGRAGVALDSGAFYSAASYCFRANAEYKRLWYSEQNWSVSSLRPIVNDLYGEINSTRDEVKARNVSTLTDIQTFMAVMERLSEAEGLLDDVVDAMKDNRTDIADDVGFAEERLFSAHTWSRFFNGDDKSVVIDEASLRDACSSKISESEERYNYVKSVLPEALDGTRKDIDAASKMLKNKEYIMCIYTGAKAKSEADVLLSLMGVEESRFDEVIDLKLSVARQNLMKAQVKGIFPIIAYSYYEYASSLRDFDRVSSLLFTEYALELANIDIYFEKRSKPLFNSSPEPVPFAFFAFLIGLAVGGLLVVIFHRKHNNKASNKVKNRAVRGSGFQTLQAPSKRRLRGKKR